MASNKLTSHDKNHIGVKASIEKQWVFDHNVANVFDDMASRSIPGYHSTQQLSVSLATQFAQPRTRIIDVGSATGTTIIALAKSIADKSITDKSIELIGIEPSQPMRAKSIAKCLAAGVAEQTSFLASTAECADFSNTSLVLFNYTLHFVPRSLRAGVLKRVYDGLCHGGLVILAEKLNYADPHLAAQIRHRYHRFKALNGYTQSEILEKESALVNVMSPLTLAENIELLQTAGFEKVEVAFEATPFATLLGWK